MRTIFLNAVVVLALLVTGWTEEKPLTSADVSAIKAVHEAYRTAWLANDDGAKVRELFTEDAVLIPHHGVEPVVTLKAIKEFWWPANSPETRITKFTTTVDELSGNATLAYVRGRSEVAWTLRDGGTTTSWRNAGNYLTLFRKEGGRWKIALQMWNDPPNQKVATTKD